MKLEQSVNTQKTFDEIFLLRQRVSTDNTLEVVHAGYSWLAKFEWFTPVQLESVIEVQNQLGEALPADYVAFLTQVANGAILFKDVTYGQWGYKIYGAGELGEKQVVWSKSLPKNWSPRFLAFAECLGEATPMIFDLDQPTIDHTSYAVVEANPIDPKVNWRQASRSFHEWLDHLVTAQGDKYWEWK